MENIYSIFRDKLLLLGEHVYVASTLGSKNVLLRDPQENRGVAPIKKVRTDHHLFWITRTDHPLFWYCQN
jgi:hypothetical protein